MHAVLLVNLRALALGMQSAIQLMNPLADRIDVDFTGQTILVVPLRDCFLHFFSFKFALQLIAYPLQPVLLEIGFHLVALLPQLRIFQLQSLHFLILLGGIFPETLQKSILGLQLLNCLRLHANLLPLVLASHLHCFQSIGHRGQQIAVSSRQGRLLPGGHAHALLLRRYLLFGFDGGRRGYFCCEFPQYPLGGFGVQDVGNGNWFSQDVAAGVDQRPVAVLAARFLAGKRLSGGGSGIAVLVQLEVALQEEIHFGNSQLLQKLDHSSSCIRRREWGWGIEGSGEGWGVGGGVGSDLWIWGWVRSEIGRKVQQYLMRESSQKLGEWRVQLRKEQINSLMKKARYQALRSCDDQLFDSLLQIPTASFTMAHLQQLLSLVNADHSNALLLLGNLVIDRQIVPEMLTEQVWRVGQNEKWTWLINVLAEAGFCCNEMFQHCLRRVVTKRSNFNLENALEAMNRLLKTNRQQFLAHLVPEFLLALANHAHDAHDRCALLAITLLSSLTSENDDIPQAIHSIVGEPRLNELVLHSLMKMHLHSRILAVQIANNFLLSGILLMPAAKRILELALVEKPSVKLQISYFWQAFAETVSEDVLFVFIRDLDLLGVMREYQRMKDHQKYDGAIASNARETSFIITRRFEQSTADLIRKEMQRVGVTFGEEQIIDESEQQTLSQ